MTNTAINPDDDDFIEIIDGCLHGVPWDEECEQCEEECGD